MKKTNIFILTLFYLTFISCSVSNINSKVHGDDILEQIKLNNSEGIKDRKAAIEYYKGKIGYVDIDDKGHFESFTCTEEDNIDDNDLKFLVFFPEMSSVHLVGKKITDKSLTYFQNLKRLRSISLNETNVSGSGFKFLLDKSELYQFEFSKSPISDEGLKYLSAINYKNPIIGLYLSESKVTDAGMPYIAKMKFDQGRISLSGTAVTDKGIKHLSGFKNMIEIFLYNTKVTDEGGKWLESQLPDTTVYWGKHKPEHDEQ